jgi:hypothetical protein
MTAMAVPAEMDAVAVAAIVNAVAVSAMAIVTVSAAPIEAHGRPIRPVNQRAGIPVAVGRHRISVHNRGCRRDEGWG